MEGASGSRKKVYEADFKAEWKVYKEAVSKYKEQLTPSQLMGLEKEARQKRLKKKAQIKRRELILLENQKDLGQHITFTYLKASRRLRMSQLRGN